MAAIPVAVSTYTRDPALWITAGSPFHSANATSSGQNGVLVNGVLIPACPVGGTPTHLHHPANYRTRRR